MQVKGKSGIDIYIINVVRERRVIAKISQSELATMLEVSNGFIGQVESSKYPTKYSTDQLNQLAKIFSCSPKDFLPQQPL